MEENELVTYEQAQGMIQDEGKDVESGMEYLYHSIGSYFLLKMCGWIDKNK